VTTGIAARLFVLGWLLLSLLCLVINSHVKNRRPPAPSMSRSNDLGANPQQFDGHHVRDRALLA